MIKYKKSENKDTNLHQPLDKFLLNVLHLLKNQPNKLANNAKRTKTKRIQIQIEIKINNNMNK